MKTCSLAIEARQSTWFDTEREREMEVRDWTSFRISHQQDSIYRGLQSMALQSGEINRHADEINPYAE